MKKQLLNLFLSLCAIFFTTQILAQNRTQLSEIYYHTREEALRLGEPKEYNTRVWKKIHNGFEWELTYWYPTELVYLSKTDTSGVSRDLHISISSKIDSILSIWSEDYIDSTFLAEIPIGLADIFQAGPTDFWLDYNLIISSLRSAHDIKSVNEMLVYKTNFGYIGDKEWTYATQKSSAKEIRFNFFDRDGDWVKGFIVDLKSVHVWNAPPLKNKKTPNFEKIFKE